MDPKKKTAPAKKKTEKTRERYGDSEFGRGCLIAKRLSERGVRMVQVYFGNSGVYGKSGNPWEVRGGTSIYPVKQRGFRVNVELIHVDHSPVGYTAYPMPVGATGNVFHVNWEMNF